MTLISNSHPVNDSQLRDIECVACQEDIHPKAIICPHCGTYQKPNQWASLGRIMKIIAGFTAVLSLIIVATDVNKLASDSREHRIAAMDLVKAAQLSWQIKDKDAALSLLKKAETIAPGNKEANIIRTDIGIATISRIYPLIGPGYSLKELSIKPDDTGIPSYHYWNMSDQKSLNLVLRDVAFPESLILEGSKLANSERARALAYLAWVELIKQNPSKNVVNIETIFNKAMNADKNDAITNLLRAAWIISERYVGLLEHTTRLEQSKASFARALAYVDKNPGTTVNGLSLLRWIRALQLEALPDVEALAIVQEIRSNGEHLPQVSTKWLTRSLFISLSGLGGSPYPEKVKKIEADLVSRFKPSELAKIATWLASIHYGCSTDGTCTEDKSAQILYAIGRMYELDGNRTRAYEYYQYTKRAGLGGWWSSTCLDGIERTKPSP